MHWHVQSYARKAWTAQASTNLLYFTKTLSETSNIVVWLVGFDFFSDKLKKLRLFRLHAVPAAAEFICHEKNIHVYINVKDRRAARKEYSIVLAAHDN